MSVRDDPRDRPVDVEVVGRFLVGSRVRPDHARDGRRPDPATVELDRSLAYRQEGESGPRDDDGRNAGCLTHLSFSSHSQEQAGCRAASPAKTPSIRASARTRGRNVRSTVNGGSGCERPGIGTVVHARTAGLPACILNGHRQSSGAGVGLRSAPHQVREREDNHRLPRTLRPRSHHRRPAATKSSPTEPAAAEAAAATEPALLRMRRTRSSCRDRDQESRLRPCSLKRSCQPPLSPSERFSKLFLQLSEFTGASRPGRATGSSSATSCRRRRCFDSDSRSSASACSSSNGPSCRRRHLLPRAIGVLVDVAVVARVHVPAARAGEGPVGDVAAEARRPLPRRVRPALGSSRESRCVWPPSTSPAGMQLDPHDW